jgi:hypothetical protein
MASAAESRQSVEPAIATFAATASCDRPEPAAQSIQSLHHERIQDGHEILMASAIDIPIEIPVEHPIDNFSAAESDAAVTLFGCDCPSCLRALEQLRSQTLLNNGQGHCWTALQRRVSQPEMQEVLNLLEAEETRELRP